MTISRALENAADTKLEHPHDEAPFAATHQHSNGNVYEVLAIALHTETRELMTVYQNEFGVIWARPQAMFEDGRFTPIGDSSSEAEAV